MQKEKEKLYNPTIDALRVLAIVAVVCIHTTTKSIQATNAHYSLVLWQLTLNELLRFAVPLFFLISGFVLELNYHFSNHFGRYLKKRFSKILLPYLFWSLLYFFFIYPGAISSLPKILLQGDASYQLYFIPALLIFYFIFPFLHVIFKQLTNKWILLLMIITQLFLLYHDYFVQQLPFYTPIRIALLNYFPFVLGMVLSKNQSVITSLKLWQKTLYLFLFCLLLVLIYMESIYTEHRRNSPIAYWSQFRPAALIYTVLFFIGTYNFLRLKMNHMSLIKQLSHLSFFVFFIHVIILEFFWTEIGYPLFLKTHGHILQFPLFDIVFFLSVVTVSFCLAYIAHKVPKLSLLTG